ncbi:MAG: FAD/NAD(P)-binding protein [Nevskia sp.]|nr:FAD/NAD(P)-binding protein [Nevskia sp.]
MARIAAAAAAADPFLPRVYRVRQARRELGDTVTLELQPESGAAPAFAPGQFNMLYRHGVGETAISISGASEDGAGFLHTVRKVGAVSAALAGLEPGAAVGVRGPFGSGWPLAAAEGADVVVVAGGLGLAPLRPAIRHLLARRERYGRVAILFGARHPRELLFRQELERWRARLDVDVMVTVDHADASWHGSVGVVTPLIRRAAFDPHETHALVCGPEVMMRFAAGALCDAGVPQSRIHLSMERNMKCAIGLCGHCQFGPAFVCKDGPVMRYDRIAGLLAVREI